MVRGLETMTVITPNIVDMSISKNADWFARLEAAIAASGKTLRQISLEAGLSHGYMHSLVSGRRAPSVPHLIKICRVLGIAVSEIVDGHPLAPETAELLEIWASMSAERRKVWLAALAAEKLK